MILVVLDSQKHVPYIMLADCHRNSAHWVLPSGPDGMHVHSLSNVDDKFYVGVIVVIRSARNLETYQFLITEPILPNTYLDILVGHTNVVRIRL